MDAPGVAAAVAEAHRREWAFVLAATVRVTRDIDLAEECVQDAYARALRDVGRGRRAGEARRLADHRRPAPGARPAPAGGDAAAGAAAARRATSRPPRPAMPFPDDRLRLVFTCCHPSLAPEAQVALTLRLLCGLSTAEVARAFLVAEPTMAARITRAKKKIATARIPYRMPSAADLPERIEAVLTVVHLLFTTGHTAPAGADLIRRDLVERALDLARMLRALLPGDADVAALLALHPADRRPPRDEGRPGRSAAAARRAGPRPGGTRPRSRRGSTSSSRRCAAGRAAGTRLQAAIAAVHAEARSWADTDWRRGRRPLRHARRGVAVAGGGAQPGGGAGIRSRARRRDSRRWSRCPPSRSWPATATCRRRGRRSWAELGRVAEARQAYQEAILLTENAVEREFLAGRLAELESSGR